MSSNRQAISTKKPEKMTAETKCRFCTGTICCNYITQCIDTPRSIDAFDYLLWQMAHENIETYKDEDGWHIIVNTRCQFLEVNGQCGIYETRPLLCREYSNDYCEFDESAENGFELYFKTYQALDDYCRRRFKKWDKRFDKK